ncbi:MAG: sulfatase-like hydrolase/transferase, partial [Ferruginibacter sp.]
AKATHKPNVYFLMFDEYAGYKSLQDSFAYRNDSLYDFLKQKEFAVLPTFANYDYTPFSMSSMLNMQYVDSNYNHTLLEQSDIQQRFGEIRNAEVFSIFKAMYYKIENYSIFGIKNNPALSGSNPLFPIHAYLLTDKIFHNRLIKDLGWWFVSGRFQIPFIKNNFILKDDRYNKKVELKVLESAATKNKQPKFCYAHFMLPHGMYFRDSSGVLNTVSQMQDLFNKPLYLSYLKYTNGVIKNMVSKIVTDDPQAIVIIMSDHGFYNYNSPGNDDPYNYDNFCLVRFPDKNYLPYKDKWSNVNFFRYLFNSQYGQNLPYLKDSSIYINE